METIIELLSQNPEFVQNLIPGAVDRYKPILYAIAEQLFCVFKDWVNNDDYYTNVALAKWKMFSALKSCGFTDEQALELMVNDTKQFRESVQKTSGASVNFKV